MAEHMLSADQFGSHGIHYSTPPDPERQAAFLQSHTRESLDQMQQTGPHKFQGTLPHPRLSLPPE